MRIRILFITSAILLASLTSWAWEAREDTYNLSDFGAVGDGAADDGPALQRALDALAEGGGGTLIVPEGRYAIITPVSKDFTGLASSVTVLGVESLTPVDPMGDGSKLSKGLDLVSEFAPKTGSTHAAIIISGLQSFLIKDIGFIGTPGVTTDAAITLALFEIEEATIRHCEFYGLSSQLQGGAIVAAIKSGLKIEQTKFLGSTCNSGVYAPVVENLQWKSIAVSDSVFVDYGQRPELFSKTGLSAPFSWINIGNAEPVGKDSPRREASIRNVFLDEGGFVGISSIPTRYQPPSAPIDLIYISGLRMNVSNLGTSGHYIHGAQAVFIENARYEWTHNADSAINLLAVGNAIIDRAECLASANRIRADAATGRLSVINSVYTYLASLAQSTNVLTTETTEEDAVQYVRQQYETVLAREPDPAGHFYWSDLILRCGDDTQCAANVRARFSSYLEGSPSPSFSIAGQALDENGNALSGVAISLSGSQAVTTQTDAAGQYSFSNLPTSGIYTITASKQHYTFDSPVQTITTPSGNQAIDFPATLNRHTLLGRVTKSSNQAVAGATVTLSGSQNATAMTDANGDYSFPNLPAGGTYTLTPSKSTYIFSPFNQTVVDLGGDITVNFTLTTYIIAGRVATAAGSGVAGVTLTLSGSETAAATTNIDGYYGFAPLPAGGNYTVAASRIRYTFDTTARTINSQLADWTAANFTATVDKFTVAGRITSNGVALSGVTVALSGSQTGTTTTDVNGGYSFSLPAEQSYTITPLKNHYTFAASSRSFDPLLYHQTADFTGTLNRHAIIGRVVNINNYGIGGVTITLSGSQTATTTTGPDGNYSFTSVAAGGTYNVTPSLKYHTFDRSSQTFVDLSSDQYASFILTLASHEIRGRVSKADGTALPDITMTLEGAQGGTTKTDAAGNYSFGKLWAGSTYVVTPSRANYAFTPAVFTASDLDAAQTANFTGGLVNYQISGRVTLGGTGMAGVSVTLSGSQSAASTTDSNGSYSFSALAEGSYTITPSKTNYTFTSPNISISNLSGNQVGNFTARLNPGVPVLISESNSTRALALDLVLRLREPFQPSYLYPWGLDHRTRLILYATNFDLQPGESPSAVTAEVKDAGHRIYPLTVEFVGKQSETEWFSRVIVRLNDDLGDVGDVLVKITYRGISSNRLRIGIGHIGGGPPDDPGSVPTPGSPPQ